MRARAASGVLADLKPFAGPEMGAASVRRRTYNRDYMRTWRSDPRHRDRERATRRKAYYARKLRQAREDEMCCAETTHASLCGFCGKLPPISEVLRLRIREDTHGAYVEVRIPYCGQC